METTTANRWVPRLLFGAAVTALVLAGPSGFAADPEVRVVPWVDLSRYTGKWYEIASFPQWFQRGCTATTATYSLRDDGKIGVLNQCRKGEPAGKLSTAEGWARVADSRTNAKLEVTFFWPFFGDYWIIDLGKDYEYAVVGHPDRDYLWILSRKPAMTSEELRPILDRAAQQGFDLSRLRYTRHH